jgi:hypothetical protein
MRALWVTAAASRRRENTFLDQPLPETDAMVEVDLKDGNGRSPARSQTGQDRPVPAEVPGPFVAAGVE